CRTSLGSRPLASAPLGCLAPGRQNRGDGSVVSGALHGLRRGVSFAARWTVVVRRLPAAIAANQAGCLSALRDVLPGSRRGDRSVSELPGTKATLRGSPDAGAVRRRSASSGLQNKACLLRAVGGRTGATTSGPAHRAAVCRAAGAGCP